MGQNKNIFRKLLMHQKSEQLLRSFQDKKYFMLLDSSSHDKGLGRFSILVFEPFLVFRSTGRQVQIQQGDRVQKLIGDPLEILKQKLLAYKTEETHGDIPFRSGCVGYFSYDLCRTLEKLPEEAKVKTPLDDIFMGFFHTAVILDHDHDQVYISVTDAGWPENEDAGSLMKEKADELEAAVVRARGQTIAGQTGVDSKLQSDAVLVSNFTRKSYCEMVSKAKEYIGNGDVFQVNLSQRFNIQTNQDPFFLYQKLRKLSPAPFSAFLKLEGTSVLSTSPERFLRRQGRRIETKPIKGTRPRGKTVEEDEKLKLALMESEKDKAELTMIVDVHRNDLGKVCKYGTVQVEKLREIETYAQVFHAVSTVSGELAEGKDLIDCIRAAFPGGSITGAPKIRSMEIIEELEGVRRGLYTGAIGYLDFNGDGDLNIAIRTIVISGNEAHYNVGGGIVWDSDPEREYEETLDKGSALMKVLGGREA